MSRSTVSINLCIYCLSRGFCHQLKSPLVRNCQIGNSDYIRDLKAFAYTLGIKGGDWQDFLSDLYRDYPGWITKPNGTEALLDMGEFERPFIREWFRDFCCTPCPDHVTPRVQTKALERVRILATILTASFPHAALFWGIRADNDNDAE